MIELFFPPPFHRLIVIGHGVRFQNEETIFGSRIAFRRMEGFQGLCGLRHLNTVLEEGRHFYY